MAGKKKVEPEAKPKIRIVHLPSSEPKSRKKHLSQCGTTREVREARGHELAALGENVFHRDVCLTCWRLYGKDVVEDGFSVRVNP